MVRSACRITLPTDVVVSSVKTYSLKLRWIVLISSAFFFLPIYAFSSYLSDVLSLLSYLSFPSLRLPRGLDDLCL